MTSAPYDTGHAGSNVCSSYRYRVPPALERIAYSGYSRRAEIRAAVSSFTGSHVDLNPTALKFYGPISDFSFDKDIIYQTRNSY